MFRIILYAGAVFVAIHGLIHSMGLVAYWPIAEIKDLPYKTTLLGGRWDVGRAGMRLFSVLWLICAIGFMVAAYGLITQQEWWRPVMLGTALLSLAITVLDWRAAFRGAIINVVILAVLLRGARIADLISLK